MWIRRLCSIINRALAWEQADRYQSARDLHHDLEDWIGGFDRRDKALRLIEDADKVKKQNARSGYRARAIAEQLA